MLASNSPLNRLFVFIMAGGSGERFWPMSRTSSPKHLLCLLGETTLLEQTVRRFEQSVPWEQIFILTNIAQVEATKAALPFFPHENIIAEPCKRDTAPAVALATALATRKRADALVALFPADAMIHDTATFQEQLHEAAAIAAEQEALLTFSITPHQPATGFGYLDLGEKIISKTKTTFQKVNRFVEKPTLEKAEEFLASGNYGWNAGMFLWQAITFIAECERLQPALATFIHEVIKAASAEKFISEKFSTLPKISVDYAIMEKASHVIAAVARFDWDDVGSWNALPKHLGVDENKNCIKTRRTVFTLDSTNNIAISQEKPIALCGVHDLVVVETADALLICHRDAVEKIKQLSLPQELR
ncbi:MAG: mannose-1-phosphate guanylyltransferase [Chthoniobacterales bacterium]